MNIHTNHLNQALICFWENNILVFYEKKKTMKLRKFIEESELRKCHVVVIH